MIKEPEPIDRALELLTAARRAAGDTVYGRRIVGVAEYLEPLDEIRARVAVGRTEAPEAMVTPAQGALNLDGRLSESFWSDASAYPLKEIVTGEPPECATTFRMVWTQNAVIFGIRCDDPDMAHLSLTTDRNGDANIFNDDTIELLLETSSHAYYQIAINAAGALVDVDRENRIDTRWMSGAEAAAYRGEDFWSLEVRVPVAGSDADTIDPLNGLAGEKPTRDDPWYFNVCRQRVREAGNEHSTFSPTGAHNFHLPLKFGKLYVK
jgi:hypothetical protein